MANLVIPNTFSPNTPAKAEEVNENFDAIETHVNSIPPPVPQSTVGLVMAPFEAFASTAAYATSTTTDMVLNNVPVVAGRRYGIHLHTVVNFSSFEADARWDFMVRLNGADYRRVWIAQPVDVGISYFTVDGIVYWQPTVTRATDDLSLRMTQVNSTANTITLVGGPTIPRTLSVVDYGTH